MDMEGKKIERSKKLLGPLSIRRRIGYSKNKHWKCDNLQYNNSLQWKQESVRKDGTRFARSVALARYLLSLTSIYQAAVTISTLVIGLVRL